MLQPKLCQIIGALVITDLFLLSSIVMGVNSLAVSKEISQPYMNNSYMTTTNDGQGGNLREKRHVPEGILDPYSVLGFLSFATFIFSILYNRHKMKPMKQGNQLNGPPGGPPMLHSSSSLLDPQENFAYIYKMASKILKNAAIQQKTQQKQAPTVEDGFLDGPVDDEDDYYDESEMELTNPQSHQELKKQR